MDQWLREVIAVTPQCLQPPTADRTEGVSPIDLKSFSGPLLVLVAGGWWEMYENYGASHYHQGIYNVVRTFFFSRTRIVLDAAKLYLCATNSDVLI